MSYVGSREMLKEAGIMLGLDNPDFVPYGGLEDEVNE
jgi:hypothetical protein